MRRAVVIGLVALLLVPTFAAPAVAHTWGRGGFHHRSHGGWGAAGFFFGLGVGTLLTAPFWYRPTYVYQPAYAYPGYAYPPSGYPVYYYEYPTSGYPTSSYPTSGYPTSGYPTSSYPTSGYPTSAPPASLTPTPAEAAPSGAVQQGAAQLLGQNCQNVWVEGHYETRVSPNGQRVTSWIPAYTQTVCQ